METRARENQRESCSHEEKREGVSFRDSDSKKVRSQREDRTESLGRRRRSDQSAITSLQQTERRLLGKTRKVV